VLIIAVIASIAFPVISRQRKQSKVTVCLTNLKQIGVATHLYAGDNDGKLIPPYVLHYPGNVIWTEGQIPFKIPSRRPAEWRRALDPFVRSSEIFFCPFDSAHLAGVPHQLADMDHLQPGELEDIRWKYTSYQTWSGLVQRLFSDGEGGLRVDDENSSTTRYLHDPFFMKDRVKQNEYPFYSLHGDVKVNTLFLDGHVKTQDMGK